MAISSAALRETDPRYHTAFISIGSNMGNKVQNCQFGIDALIRSGYNVLRGQSRFYLTEPTEYPKQEWFVNVAVKIETELDPTGLLRRLQTIEAEAGRSPGGVRFGPRILDMDIILYDDLVMETPDLVIPHSRMHKRRFVLQPVCDIDSTVVHPVLKTQVGKLLDQLDHTEQRIIVYPCG